jgi:hypothetical protein
VCHGSASGALALILAAALLWAQPAGASTVYRLPRSDYTVRAACAAPAPGRAGCLALQLVPSTAEARGHTHPIGVASATLATPATPPSPAASDFGVTPADLHTAYLLPTSASSTQTIALVDAYNDPSAEADLATYSKEFGIPECTAASGCFKQVNQDDEATNLPFPQTRAILTKAEKRCIEEEDKEACYDTEEAEGWAVEISLDIETARAVCQNCHIALVEADTPSYENLETAEDTAVALGANEVSNSWAGPECGGGCLGDSSAFNHPGVVIAAAAGDDGYLNWLERSRSPYANFPAVSPQVVAVGGTRLKLESGGEWNGETVWNDGGENKRVKDGHGAGGGGCSAQFEAQPWQQDLPDWSTVGCGSKRAVADVSADADPYTGVAVYDSGPGFECETESGGHVVHWCTYGGTSAASPLIAATFALAGGANGVEYPARTLYENAAKSPGSLHDVTEGSNGECLTPFNEKTGLPSCTSSEEGKTSCDSEAICLARTGYDGPTGVGTPDGIAAFTPTPDAPAVATGTASAVTQTSAILQATVNPDGREVTECKLEYGVGAVEEASVPCSTLPLSGTSAIAVSAPVAGLTLNTRYRFRISATNSDGTSIGDEQTFRTLPNRPSVTTGVAGSLSPTSATLNAEVDPNGAEITACTLDYGTSVIDEASVPCSSLPGSGTSPVEVSAAIAGLDADTAYRFRISATNAGGTSEGGEQDFQTPPAPPTVTTGAASSITQTSATLHAEVNPNGQKVTECKLEYGTTTAYGSSAPCEAPPGSVNKLVTVTASLTGLTAVTTYHFRIVATNAQGTSEGNDETFATLLPTTLQQQVPDEQGTSNGHGVSDSQARKQTPVPDAELASASLTASPSGWVIVRVSCPADESSCSGKVTLRTLSAVIAGADAHQSKNAKAAILTLAAGAFKVAGGRVTTVRLHLSAKARTLLARIHVLRARATVLAHDPAGATHTAQSIVTIRAHKASGSRHA